MMRRFCVFQPVTKFLVTTDFSLEGVHSGATGISRIHRTSLLTRGLSDIAAMGGRPLAAFLSLALPAKLRSGWVDGFLRGLLALARQHSVILAGAIRRNRPVRLARKVLADITCLLVRCHGARRCNVQALSLATRSTLTGKLGARRSLRSAFCPAEKETRSEKAFLSLYPQPRLGRRAYLREHGIATSMSTSATALHRCTISVKRAASVSVAATKLIPRADGATLSKHSTAAKTTNSYSRHPRTVKFPARLRASVVTRMKLRKWPTSRLASRKA